MNKIVAAVAYRDSIYMITEHGTIYTLTVEQGTPIIRIIAVLDLKQ